MPAAQILKKQMCCGFFRHNAYIKVFSEIKLQQSNCVCQFVCLLKQ